MFSQTVQRFLQTVNNTTKNLPIRLCGTIEPKVIPANAKATIPIGKMN